MPNIEILTQKEKQVLVLLIEAKPYKQMSCEMYISTDTVKKHIKNIYKKIGVNSRSEALLWLLVNLYPNMIDYPKIKQQMGLIN